jgi:hypothetical protein
VSRDFASELASLRAKLESDHLHAVYGLREVEEAWARQLLNLGTGDALAPAVHRQVKSGLGAVAGEDAEAHLAEAEKWQSEIGTYASGSGEGLASMAEVRSLQMARAWLAAALFQETGKKARETLARSLAKKIEGDPNGLGKRYAKSLTELRAMLDHAVPGHPRKPRGGK